jgi:hypothetical protein
MLMALPPGKRLAMAFNLFQTAKALARADILRAGPLPECEVRRQLFLRFYGCEFQAEERARILASL